MRALAPLLLISLIVLPACGDKAEDETDDDDDPGSEDGAGDDGDGGDDGTDPPVDADSDGYTEGDDCDDDNAAIHPEAEERCDGLDNDCDGIRDEEDATDALTWYADADSDGFGDPDSTERSCAAPGGYVVDDRDCDDTDPDIHLGAVETCDGADNDCDGDIDEPDAVDASTWYADTDGDGHGDAAVSQLACAAPSGFVEDDTDCDDTDDGISPSASETCNGIDDDCGGDIDEDDATDAPTWYADTDGDGFGNPSSSTRACSQPSGSLADDRDCDDGDPGIHPAAQELCATAGVDDDCDGTIDESAATDAPTWYADADVDGYGDPAASAVSCTAPSGYLADDTDCDDAAAAVNPAATETCNSVDDDCDGSLDEPDAADASTWYADADGDGHGDPATSEVACTAPSGTLADDTDCNDGDSSISPSATETCNGIDDDCNGSADDNATDADTWYRDADADGYGVSSTTIRACSQPSGYTASSTDCNDTSALIYPGAEEVCWDSVDRDCDGYSSSDTDCAPSGTVAIADRDDNATHGTAGDNFGAAVATGDFDGDGDDELVASSLRAGAGGTVWMWDGLDPFSVGSTSLATLSVTGAYSSSQFGSAIDLGDLDGDGLAELIVGAPLDDAGATNAGRVFIYAGSATASGALANSSAIAHIAGTETSAYVGSAVSAGGDIDGDGLLDLAIGARGATRGGGNLSPGAVYLFAGGVSGSLDTDDADHSLLGEHAGDLAGIAVAIAPDVDGDGLDDVLVGASSNDGSGTDGGAVYLFSGGALDGIARLVHATTIVRGEEDDALGRSVAGVGDVNADGWGDFLVGLPGDDSNGTDAGAAALFYGPAGALRGGSPIDADLLLLGEAAGDGAGEAVAGGDTDGDGYIDLLIGASDHDQGGSDAGAAYLVRGGTSVSSLDLGSATLELVADAGDGLGNAVAMGDLDGDGYADLAVAASSASTGSTSNHGEVAVVLGGARVQTPAVAPAPDATRDDDGDGSTEAGGDCDDRKAAIEPGATETCGDGIDDDCDGFDLACALSGTVVDLDAWAGVFDDGSGMRVENVGDLNGDGYDDLGVNGYMSVSIYFGPLGPGTRLIDHAPLRLEGSHGTGFAFSSAGDLNGDGIGDIVLGSYWSSTTYSRGGGAYIVYGQPGLEGTLSMPGDADIVIEPESTNDSLGYAVAGGGDFDGDGIDDVAISAPDADGSFTASGVVYVFAGGLPSGTYSAAEADYIFGGENKYEATGESLSLASDANGDGLVDLLIGSPEHDYDDGAAFLAFGPPQPGYTDLRAVPARFVGGNRTGIAVASLGDLNADGYDDIAIGAPSYDSSSIYAGSLHIFFGPLHAAWHLIDDADVIIEGTATGGELGAGIAQGGDIDGDGYDDLLVGAPSSDASGYEWGGAWLYHGPLTASSYTPADADISFVPSGIANAGYSATLAGDFDGDGYDDVVVGMPDNNANWLPWTGGATGLDGLVTIYRGGPRSGVPTITPATLDPSTDDDGDGLSEDAGDCDDSRATIYPGATETCENQLDEDCSGQDDWCVPDGTITRTDEPAFSANTGDQLGAAIGLMDLDGDGYDDLVMGAPYGRGKAYRDGHVLVAWGPVPRGERDLIGPGIGADTQLTGSNNHDNVGFDLAPLGDLDGDGDTDLVTAAFGLGEVYLISDETAGTTPAEIATVADTLVLGSAADYFGAHLSAGDLDADGHPDLLVGAHRESTGGTYRGAVYLFYGPLTARAYTSASADAVVRGSTDRAALGRVSVVGDVDGDGNDDVLMGASGAEGSAGVVGTGEAYLAYGSASITSISAPSADVVFEAESSGDGAGGTVASAGDVDGDGLADLLISASSSDAATTDAGAAYLFYGGGLTGTLSLSSADLRLLGATTAERLGAVGAAGDVDGDGIGDILAGASGTEELYLFRGVTALSGDVSSAAADAAISPYAGSTVRVGHPGDHNGDGFDDIVVAATGSSVVWVLPGGVD